MIPLSELYGRPVVDLDSAATIGIIDAAILDPDNRRVVGFIIAHGSRLLPGHATSILPASAIHAIGPDALTAHDTPMATEELLRLERFPRVADVVGRHVVTRGGRNLGMIDDVVIDDRNGRIVGYSLGPINVPRRVEQRLAARGAYPSTVLVRTDLVVMRVLEDAVMRFVRPIFVKDDAVPYIRADADIRVGPDLVIVADDAVSRDWAGADAVASIVAGADAHAGWSSASPGATGESQWSRARRVA